MIVLHIYRKIALILSTFVVLIQKSIDSNKEIEFDNIPPNWLVSASQGRAQLGTILDNQSIKISHLMIRKC